MSHPIFPHTLPLFQFPKPFQLSHQTILFTEFHKRMASISSILSPNLLQQHLTKPFAIPQQPNSKLSLHSFKSPNPTPISLRFSISHLGSNSKQPKWVSAVAEETSVSTQDPSSEAARRVYIGNIPRTVNNDELRQIVEEHGAVEKAEVMFDKYSGRSRRFAFVTMKTVEDANAAIEKLNGTQIGGREIKANITEKPLQTMDLPFSQSEESEFIDSPHKVYVGNLAKTVTTEMLKNFFAEKGKVLSAKVSRVPGTSKSSGFGFVTFSSEEDVEAVISSVNNAHGHLQLRGSSRSLIEEPGQTDQIPSNQFFVEKSKSGSQRTELIIPKSIKIDNLEGIPHKEESLDLK